MWPDQSPLSDYTVRGLASEGTQVLADSSRPEPSLAQVEAALQSLDAARSAAEVERHNRSLWARDVLTRWSSLTEAERMEVMRRVFQRLFAEELAS